MDVWLVASASLDARAEVGRTSIRIPDIGECEEIEGLALGLKGSRCGSAEVESV